MNEKNPIIQEDLDHIVATKLPWDILKNKIILVTGGAGFLGSYLVKSMLVANHKYGLNLRILCAARGSPGAARRLVDILDHPSLRIVTLDISGPIPFDFPRADFILHCASQASPKYYGIDPVGTLKANSAGTMHLLEHAAKRGCDAFLFFSSGEVYGAPLNAEGKVSEIDYGYLDPMELRSCYSESKRMGETMCVAWSKQYGIHAAVVRPFHTYGPGLALDDGRVFADFVADVVANRDIVLKSDGTARRSFCYVADATTAFLTVLLKGDKAQAYNVGNPHTEVSMSDLAHTICGLFPERGIKVRFDISPASFSYLKSPISRQYPDIEKISKIGWQPETDIANGFKRTILSYSRVGIR